MAPLPQKMRKGGRDDGMRSDSTKTFHNGPDLGTNSTPTWGASVCACTSKICIFSSAFRMFSNPSQIMDLVPHHPNKQARRGTHPTKLRRELEPNFRHYFFAREGRIEGGGEIFDMKTSTTSMHCIKNEERIEVIQGSANWWAPGCVNAAGKARQK